MFPSQRIINRKNFLIIFFLWILFLGAFQIILRTLQKLTGLNNILDLYFHYNASDVHTLFSFYGETGRKWYLIVLILDTIFPILYGLLLWMSITYLSLRIPLPWNFYRYLQALPFIAVIIDYLENIFEFWMTLSPNVINKIAPVSGWITTIKWIFVYASVLVLIFLVLIYFYTLNTRRD